jgi:hypothetical protein
LAKKNLKTEEINTEILSATNPIRMTTWYIAARKDTQKYYRHWA